MAPHIFHQGKKNHYLDLPLPRRQTQAHIPTHPLCLMHGRWTGISHCHRDCKHSSKSHSFRQRARTVILASKRCPEERYLTNTFAICLFCDTDVESGGLSCPRLAKKAAPFITLPKAESHPWPWLISWHHLYKWPLKLSLHINAH